MNVGVPHFLVALVAATTATGRVGRTDRHDRVLASRMVVIRLLVVAAWRATDQSRDCGEVF